MRHIYFCTVLLAGSLLYADLERSAEQATFSAPGIYAVFAESAGGGLCELRMGPDGPNLLETSSREAFARESGDPEFLATSACEYFRLRLSLPPQEPEGKPVQKEVSCKQARSVRFRTEGQTLIGEFTDFAAEEGPDLTGLAVQCRVRIEGTPPALCWRFAVDLPTGMTLRHLLGPVLHLALPLGNDPDGEAVVSGTTKGGVLRKPQSWKRGKTVDDPNPGRLAAQFGCAYGREWGVETETHDPKGYPKDLLFQRSPTGLLLCWRHRTYSTKHFETDYDSAVRPFHSPDPGRPADWRDAADLYKSWAVQQPWCVKTFAERDNLPAWLQSGPSMVRFSREWLTDPAKIRLWLEQYWRGKLGAPGPLIVTFWGWENKGTWVGSEYFPPYPSEEAFRSLVQDIKGAGGHVFLWPSGHHWAITYNGNDEDGYAYENRERYEKLGPPHTIIKEDGTPMVYKRRWLRGGTTSRLCCGDPWTRDWFADIAEGCVKYGADMVQVDQVVSGAIPDCYSTEHSHPVGTGVWKWQTFMQQMEEMTQRCRALDPAFVAGVEEPEEMFIQQVGVQDYRDAQVMTRHKRVPGHTATSVFGYLYHEYLPVFQSNPIGGDAVNTAYCIAMGQMPHFVPQLGVCYDRSPVNGDFEEWNDNVPSGWSKVGGYKGEVWDGLCGKDDSAAVGKACLRLDSPEGKMVQVSQNVPSGPTSLRVGGQYRVAIRLRSQGVQPEQSLRFSCFGPGWRGTGGCSIEIPLDTGGSWQEETADFTVPEGTTVLRIMLQLREGGTVWLDDLQLLEVRENGTTTPVGTGIPSEHVLVKQWTRLFAEEGRPWLLHGRMLHPPGLDVETIPYAKQTVPAVFHNAFRSPDGREALLLVNATDAERNVTVYGQGEKGVQSYTLKPYEIRLQPNSGSLDR